MAASAGMTDMSSEAERQRGGSANDCRSAKAAKQRSDPCYHEKGEEKRSRLHQMKAIAAVDSNWGIGRDNRLLISIPEDMRFFRETTSGGVVIMGRKTLESFPGGRPLKNRVNIVFTRNPLYEKEGVIVVHSFEELRDALREHSSMEAFVIGGASIYRQMVPMCDTVYITKVDKAYEADAFFPDLDADPEWEAAEESELKEYEGLTYRFVTYRRSGKAPEENAE